ncbi:MAG: hypothetical protein BMS9Abin02_0790 [Anaerolineae bacterium]|nr:MAG: hypothetical protein BMS9Abin02_0790 [Anaerolineae bacterium]
MRKIFQIKIKNFKAFQQEQTFMIIAKAPKIPEKVLEEDQKLLMWYDQAATRVGGEV